MRKLDLSAPQWQQAGPWTADLAAVVTAQQAKEFFRVIGPSPSYAGSASCAECHPAIHQSEMDTRHAHALETLNRIRQGNNAACLPCHTVGYGLPTGFTTEAATPQLAGVQCENCHGPAANHVADPFELTVRPRVEIAGQMCGGCHTDAHHPTYDEWDSSGHAEVVEDMNGGRLEGCGRCHSGSSRLAQLAGLSGAALTAAVNGDANVGITCVVCHDPHRNTMNGYQLRDPAASTNDYFVLTSGTLLCQYDSAVNLCAQCHNHRGARWDADTTKVITLACGTMVTNSASTRAPHHSPQYNMLLATIGEYPPGYSPAPSTHGGTRYVTNVLNQVLAVTNQCVTCHMQTEEYQEGPPEVAANTGHTFSVDSYQACLGCHAPLFSPEEGEALVQDFVDYTAWVVNMEILETQALLDEWAVYYAPAAITNYGTLAWEYRPAGDLSQPPEGPERNGPTLKEQQDWVPNNIKKARFNLYMVYYDGSFGVHNGPYALNLLKFAQQWVREEMMGPP
jgi:hypothetical protein